MSGGRIGMAIVGSVLTLAGAGVGVGASASFLFLAGLILLVGALLFNSERTLGKALLKAALLISGAGLVLASTTLGPAPFFIGGILFILGLDFDSMRKKRADQAIP
jgi:hypothetical protein